MRQQRKSESGITLIELVFVVALVGLVLASTIAVSRPWLDRETLRSATFELQSTIQLNRMEAVSRNRECRMVINADTRALEVWDGSGTAGVADDQLIYRTTLASRITFDRPDAGAAITLTALGDSQFEVVARADGTVASGQGEIVLSGGEYFNRLRLYVAGGTEIQRWRGYGWGS